MPRLEKTVSRQVVVIRVDDQARLLVYGKQVANVFTGIVILGANFCQQTARLVLLVNPQEASAFEMEICRRLRVTDNNEIMFAGHALPSQCLHGLGRRID